MIEFAAKAILLDTAYFRTRERTDRKQRVRLDLGLGQT